MNGGGVVVAQVVPGAAIRVRRETSSARAKSPLWQCAHRHYDAYILRNPFSVEKMTLESPTDTVIYRSKLNAKINRS